MKHKSACIIIAVIDLCACCLCAYSIGLEVGHGRTEIIEIPVVNTINNTVEKIVEVPVDKIVEVPVEKIVTEIKEVPVYLPCREFESLTEFTAWADDKLAVLWPVEENDCDDYAERFQVLAASDGYLLSCQLVENGRIFGVVVSNSHEPHMGNLAIIKNAIYFIESEPTHYRIIRICVRD